MSTPPPGQPSFQEAQELALNPHFQALLRWFPDQPERVLAAWRRRHKRNACACPACQAPRSRPASANMPSMPSKAGQYRRQILK